MKRTPAEMFGTQSQRVERFPSFGGGNRLVKPTLADEEPCEHGVVAIKSGIIENYDGDDPTCTPKIYGPGDVFTEMPGHIHFVRSIGPADYEAYAMFVLPVAVASRQDVPSPGNCPF